MIGLLKVRASVAKDKRAHEIELVFDKRKYRLAADNPEDCATWLAVLGGRCS